MSIRPSIPSFSEAYQNHSDPGTHFQCFVAELFADQYIGLIAYTAAGRDGGIDLFHPDSGTVFECKFIGAEGADAALQRWKETSRHLKDNLLPNKPKQSQYAPWYNQATPITTYRFCTSQRLENESRRQDLQTQIQTFFHQHAKTDASLNHLAQVQVNVWSWDRLQPHLEQRGALRLKWFNLANPRGLEWLQADVPLQNNFRDYLDERRLPFYSLPELDVTHLYARLRQQPVGLIAHGQGGVGKTRLLRELGLHALGLGHAVYLVKPATIKPEALEQLAREAAGTPLLLLMDYIERIPAFEELVGVIEEYNDDGADIRLFATCRNSHFQAHRSAHSLGELPMDNIDRLAVARHILQPMREQAEPLLELCHGIPILAVFLRYLHDTGKAAELHSLREDGDFNRWWGKRLPSLGDANARLLALYPCADDSLDALFMRCPDCETLHQHLCRDGWVYQDAADDAWHLAHDLLADQTLLQQLQDLSTRRRLLRQLLQDALACHAEESVLLALRRIAEHLPDTPWFKLFEEQAAAWRSYLPLLLTGNLFNVAERLTFLDLFAAEAVALTAEHPLQGVLGWITRQCWKHQDTVDAERLHFWLDAVATQELANNFVLTQALRWDNQRYAESALAWLQQHPPSVQSHFLLCTWLDTDQPVDAIKELVSIWLQRYGRSRWATFVLYSWLDATQDGDFIKQAVCDWLQRPENRLSPEAEFVFKAWLDATRDGAFIKQAVDDWLQQAENRLSPEASYVYKAWLDATQDGAFIKQAVGDWLQQAENRLSLAANFVFKAWLDATQDDAFIKQAVDDWLQQTKNRVSPEASHIYTAWLDATQDGAFIKQAVDDWLQQAENRLSPEAGFVYGAWLDATQDGAFIKQAVDDWLQQAENRLSPEAGFVYGAWLDATQDGAFIKQAVDDWLQQAENRLSPEAGFVYGAWLDATQNGAFIKQAVCDWLTSDENRFSPKADFVYKAWLVATHNGALIKKGLADWLTLDENRLSPEACFVYKAWLDATHDVTFIENALGDWLKLDENRLSPEANYIYTAWLKAKGKRSLIKKAILDWLAHDNNAIAYGADFIYSAWGNVEKALSLAILPHACAWLRVHAEELDAKYFLKYIVRAVSLDADTLRAVLIWCRAHHKNENAFESFCRLQEKLQILPISEVLPAWQAVLVWRLIEFQPVFGFEPIGIRRTFHILHGMAQRDVNETAMEKLVDLFAHCLIKTDSFSITANADKESIHDASFPDMALRLLDRENRSPALNHGLKELLAWIDTWTEDEKLRYCSELLAALRHKIT